MEGKNLALFLAYIRPCPKNRRNFFKLSPVLSFSFSMAWLFKNYQEYEEVTIRNLFYQRMDKIGEISLMTLSLLLAGTQLTLSDRCAYIAFYCYSAMIGFAALFYGLCLKLIFLSTTSWDHVKVYQAVCAWGLKLLPFLALIASVVLVILQQTGVCNDAGTS